MRPAATIGITDSGAKLGRSGRMFTCRGARTSRAPTAILDDFLHQYDRERSHTQGLNHRRVAEIGHATHDSLIAREPYGIALGELIEIRLNHRIPRDGGTGRGLHHLHFIVSPW